MLCPGKIFRYYPFSAATRPAKAFDALQCREPGSHRQGAQAWQVGIEGNRTARIFSKAVI
jgi:hypothetical protein